MSQDQLSQFSQSPIFTTSKIFAQIIGQISALTLKTDNLSQQNNNRMEEISSLANKMGFPSEAISDYPELTEAEDIKNLEEKNIKSLEDLKIQHSVENRRRRNQQILEAREKQKDPYFSPTAPRLEEETLKAKDILDTITILKGQDDIGGEDFIKNIKRAKIRCSQPHILLDFILAQKVKGLAEKAIRFIPIDSYEDLFNALRQNLKQTGSILTFRSKLESCKQGQTETVQNFSLHFRQITNELNYCIQGEHTSPVERRLRIKIEETENIRRYLSKYKKRNRYTPNNSETQHHVRSSTDGLRFRDAPKRTPANQNPKSSL